MDIINRHGIVLVILGIFAVTVLAESANEASPTVVILPPKLSVKSKETTRAAAELLCDRLAEAIAQTKAARVVDRTQLDRVLRERKLAAGPGKAMLSYDAMVRVSVDAACLVPKVRLSLLELSTGNVMASADYPWPMKDANLGKMAFLCKSALSSLGKFQRGKLRVRMTGVESIGAQVRMQSLGLRLNEVFQKSLQRSERIVLVQHLEAGTSKEESLLLLMGLTRLAGSRRFTPQADATVELRVIERDSIGKTFEQTPVEIGVRLRKGAKYIGEWVIVSGKVKDFDRLVQQAWSKFAEGLSEAKAGTAAKFLNEMSVRRKQAEAELKAADGIKPDLPREQRLLARLAHVEAALKIDPTYEPAAFDEIRTLWHLCAQHHVAKYANSKKMHQLMFETARYVQMFGDKAKRCAQVQDHAWAVVRFTPLIQLYKGRQMKLTPKLRRLLDAMKQIVEHCSTGDIRKNGWASDRMVSVVYRGMRLADVPLEERRRWLEQILKHRDEQARQIPGTNTLIRDNVTYMYNAVWFCAAQMAVEDGEFERAKNLIEQVRSRIKQADPYMSKNIQQMRKVLTQTNDAEALARFNQWANRYSKVVCFMRIKWPSINIYGRQRVPSVRMINIRHKALNRYSTYAPTAALVEGNNRLYVIMARGFGNPIGRAYFVGTIGPASESQVVAYIPLNEKGQPVGQQVPMPKRRKRFVWDGIKIIPQPKVRKTLHVLCARYINGKLYLGTMCSGLLVFDPKTGKWTVLGPQQGLPAWSIYSFFLIDKQTLFCSGRVHKPDYVMVHYTLNLETGKVTLLRRTDFKNRKYIPKRLNDVWRNGKELVGCCRLGLWRNLLSSEPKHTKFRFRSAYGWGGNSSQRQEILDIEEIDGRRFFTTTTGLHECSSAGKVIRTWWRGARIRPSGSPDARNTVVFSRNCPVRSPYMVKSGNLLYFLGANTVAYDPRTDTWYGPVSAQGGTHNVGTSAGLWVGSGLTYFNNTDVIAAAKAAGRVMTTEQWRKRKQQFIESAPLMDRAKFAFGMRQFDVARQHLTQVLKSDPNNAEALLLMGYLHDTWCTNKPDEAIKYYRRMESLTDNPSASISGMFMRFHLHKRRKEYAQAYQLTKEIPKRFGRLEDHAMREMTRWEKRLKKELDKETKK